MYSSLDICPYTNTVVNCHFKCVVCLCPLSTEVLMCGPAGTHAQRGLGGPTVGWEPARAPGTPDLQVRASFVSKWLGNFQQVP